GAVRRARAATARGREEGARRRRDGLVGSPGAGSGRAIPGPRRAIRTAGSESRRGGAAQGSRRGQSQRRTVAAVGAGGRGGPVPQGLTAVVRSCTAVGAARC